MAKKVTDYADLNIDGLSLREAIDLLEHAAEDFGDDKLIEVEGDYAGGWVRFQFQRDETADERKLRLERMKIEREDRKRAEAEKKWRKYAAEMVTRDREIINSTLKEWEKWRIAPIGTKDAGQR
jgi:hypothetical protein